MYIGQVLLVYTYSHIQSIKISFWFAWCWCWNCILTCLEIIISHSVKLDSAHATQICVKNKLIFFSKTYTLLTMFCCNSILFFFYSVWWHGFCQKLEVVLFMLETAIFLWSTMVETWMVRLKALPHIPVFYKLPERKPFENNVGKGENAGYQYFLLFQQYFLTSKYKFYHCNLLLQSRGSYTGFSMFVYPSIYQSV